ncbi:MAG: aminodeoxychorismate/anthranilate synthase component II [Deltaproteobacteria bacterium]|nr:aminodeoxychorismate/anthranilate synthase component II [Deltaproteobacteria bacterium]
MAKLLVIDNYDSFTYNLVQMFKLYDLSIHVKRSDDLTLDDAKKIDPDYILISPGPKSPTHSGISVPLILEFYKKIPVLGVCLGMQCINEAFGGRTIKAEIPVHGKISEVRHTGNGIFKNIPESFNAARYHSLVVERKNGDLVETAHTGSIVMGFQHKTETLYGVQFHPESFMTEYGEKIIENFLNKGVLKA